MIRKRSPARPKMASAPHRAAQAKLVKAGRLIKQVVSHEAGSIRKMQKGR